MHGTSISTMGTFTTTIRLTTTMYVVLPDCKLFDTLGDLVIKKRYPTSPPIGLLCDIFLTLPPSPWFDKLTTRFVMRLRSRDL